MEAAQSDALVFFGASGDLAFKQIFPALLGLAVGDEGVNVPIVGVAKAGLDSQEQLKGRATDSIKKHGGADAAKLDKLLGLLRYVDGDYNDPQTFAKLEAGARRRQAGRCTILAIPPSLFGGIGRLGARPEHRHSQRRRAPRRRETVRPRSPIGAERSTTFCSSIFPEELYAFASTIIWERSRSRTSSTTYAVRQRDVRAARARPRLCPLHPDHHGGSVRRSGPGAASMTPSAHPSPIWSPEPHASGSFQCDDGRPDRRRARGAARDQKAAVLKAIRPLDASEHGAAGNDGRAIAMCRKACVRIQRPKRLSR